MSHAIVLTRLLAQVPRSLSNSLQIKSNDTNKQINKQL